MLALPKNEYSPVVSLKYLIMNAKRNASTGDSRMFITIYCRLLIFESTSRSTNTRNCLNLLGIFDAFSGKSSYFISGSGIVLRASWKWRNQSSGCKRRAGVRLPYSSSICDSTMLKICSGLTLPQVWHSLSFQLA